MAASYWSFNSGVRASDAERERAATALKRHFTAGRLSAEEFEKRVRQAYEAEWRGELRGLLRDLPFEPPIDRTRVARGVDRVQQGVYRAHLACFTTFNTACVGVWAWSGGHEFWPALTLIPGGALLAWHRRGTRSLSRRLVSGGGEPRRAISL